MKNIENPQKDLGEDAFLPLPPREILESGQVGLLPKKTLNQARYVNPKKFNSSKVFSPQMQPLEMILGFNKDEGLHVIIDLLMDPTNDTNFRLVMQACSFSFSDLF